MKKLRDYQIEISNKANTILKRFKLVFLICEVRTGKTLMALNTAKLYGAKNVLFLTKKRAISSIENDYNDFGYSSDYKITIINNESLHKVEGNFDFIVMDESHRFGSFPKPCKMAKDFKNRFSNLPIIMMTGTFHPESYSQVYHQFWCSDFSPFQETNFYKWAKKYVDVKDRHFGYAVVKDYSNGKKEFILPVIKPYLITFTQNDAGFETSVKKNIIYCEPEQQLIDYSKKLAKNKFLTINGHEIEADTAVKLQNKIHQISNGTVISENGNTLILSDFKARFIQQYFMEKKLAIFYYYRAEWNLLKSVFGDTLTNDLREFKDTNKHIALQQVSGSEGISLKEADVLVYYNFGFSNVKFVQGIDRLTTMDRKENNVYFVFSKGSINERIYNTIVYQKKDYILSAFKKDFDIPYNYDKL